MGKEEKPDSVICQELVKLEHSKKQSDNTKHHLNIQLQNDCGLT